MSMINFTKVGFGGFMDSIGERLKAWRKKNELTLTEISEKTGLSTGGLSAYERNEKQIGTKSLLALWYEYHIDIAWILTGEKGKNLLPDEQQLIDFYRSSDSRGRRTILRTAESESRELASSVSKTGSTETDNRCIN